jgi:ATP-dependent RNA helicase DDX31/DBP7
MDRPGLFNRRRETEIRKSSHPQRIRDCGGHTRSSFGSFATYDSLLLDLKGKLEWFVMDEADRLLDDMELGEQLTTIIQRLRANQQAAFRSVIVSATVTKKVEELARSVLSSPSNGIDDQWVFVVSGVAGRDDKMGKQTGGPSTAETRTLESSSPATKDERSLTEATPRQLSHLHVTVSAKLRLVTLVALLAQRVAAGERTVVFLSTCASVDFHHALFTSLASNR